MTNIKSADVEAGIRKAAVECPPRGHKADMLSGRHDRLQVPGKANTKNETLPVPAHGARGKIGLRFFSQGGGHGAAIDRAARSASCRAGYILFCPTFFKTRCVGRRRWAATPQEAQPRYFCETQTTIA